MPDDNARPMVFAFADPPYIGCAKRYPEKTEVDHGVLISDLFHQFPDGWALCCSSPSLAVILRHCWEKEVRVMAWVKPFAVFKANVGVAYAWEPVIVCGGRKRTREQPTVRDWHSEVITLKRGLVGAKPDSFCRWILDILNYQDGDEIVDLFPGTGTMTTRQGKCG